MQETKETSIDGFDVRVTQHRARRAAVLLSKVGRVIAPGLARIGGASLSGDIKDADLSDLGPAVSALFESLGDDSVDSLLCEILSQATIVMPDDGGTSRLFDLSKPDQIDAAFTGRLPLMFKVAKYALEVNFGSFFAARGVLAAVAAAGARATPST